jgi:hypothetical protein
MNRNEKLKKLGNAIKGYRGLKDPKSGAWQVTPKPADRARVLRWAGELKLPADTLAKVNAFKSVGEYSAWIKSL